MQRSGDLLLAEAPPLTGGAQMVSKLLGVENNNSFRVTGISSCLEKPSYRPSSGRAVNPPMTDKYGYFFHKCPFVVDSINRTWYVYFIHKSLLRGPRY